jgi:hypothetical protein
MSDDTFDPEVRILLDELIAQYPLVGHVRISAIALGDHALAITGKNSVLLNADQWTPEVLARHEKEWDGLVVDSSKRGVVTHEFGHVYFHTMQDIIGFHEAIAIVYRHAGIENENQGIWNYRTVSPYGQENSSEFIAEAFAAYHFGRASADNEICRSGLSIAYDMWSELENTARNILAARAEAAPDLGHQNQRTQ